jgi:hypothetical protein
LEAYYPPNSSILKKSVLINSENSSNKQQTSIKKASLSYIHEEDDEIQIEEILQTQTDDQVLFRASGIESQLPRFIGGEGDVSDFDNKP